MVLSQSRPKKHGLILILYNHFKLFSIYPLVLIHKLTLQYSARLVRNGYENVLYVTIGTGIGAGAHVEGKLLHSSLHPAWDLEACYIAQAILNHALIVSPQVIILGGEVMAQRHLFPMIHKYTQETLGGYVHKQEIITDQIKEYIVKPKLNTNSGIIRA